MSLVLPVQNFTGDHRIMIKILADGVNLETVNQRMLEHALISALEVILNPGGDIESQDDIESWEY